MIFVFIVLAAAGLFACWTAIPPVQPAPPAPPPSPPVRPYAASPNAAVIDAGLSFLCQQAVSDTGSWQVYALLDYLRRRFGLEDRYRMESLFPRKKWPEYDRDMAAIFYRIVDNAHRVPCERLSSEENELNRFMALSLYCDSCSVPEPFIDNLVALYQKDIAGKAPGYIATHAIMCFQWLRELGCDRNTPKLEELRPGFEEVLAAIIDREQAATDLAFEAMAFLYYIGAGDRVRPEWINTVMALQRPSGAWGYRYQDPDHGHPTALALWVLLEEALPEVPRKPWLVPGTE